MKFNDISDLCFDLWCTGAVDTPLCLLGMPGIGKSALAEGLAARMTRHRNDGTVACVESRDLTSAAPEDFPGLPFNSSFESEGDTHNYTDYSPLLWFLRLCSPDAYGVLILDDLPAAPGAVQVAVRQLVLYRRIGDHRLSDGIFIVVTGNRRSDESSATTLPAHFRNSVWLCELDVDFNGWCEWYADRGDMDPVVPAFLSFVPGMFAQGPKTSDPLGAFATPRTWAKLGRIAKALGDRTSSAKLLNLAQGLVGQAASVQFAAYVAIRSQLVNPEDVLKNPQKALPAPAQVLDSRDKLHAMLTSLVDVAVDWHKNGKPGAASSLLLALAHVYPEHTEFFTLAITLWIRATKDMAGLLEGLKDAKTKNPKITDMTETLRDAFSRHKPKTTEK